MWFPEYSGRTFLESMLQMKSDSLNVLSLRRLTNKHLIFVGDSLMRFQYLALVYLVKFKTIPLDDVIPNFFVVKTWNGWNNFFNGTNAMLRPNEWCDCYRDEKKDDDGKGFENRYFTDSVNNISISYFQFSEINVQGHWSEPYDDDFFRSPHYEFYPHFWRYGLSDAMIHFIKNVPDNFFSILILNSGHHANSFTFGEGKNKVSNLKYATLVRDSAVITFDQVIWKTFSAPNPDPEVHSWERDAYHPQDSVMCSLQNITCFNLSWTQLLQPHHYYDNLHFKASVYNLINLKLLDTIDTYKKDHSP